MFPRRKDAENPRDPTVNFCVVIDLIYTSIKSQPIRHTVTSQKDQGVTSESDPSQKTDVTDQKSRLSASNHYDVTDVTDQNQDTWERIA